MSTHSIFIPQQKTDSYRFQLPKGIASLRSPNGERLTRLASHSAFEFRELKNYTEGDSLKNIHWKTASRVGNLMVKTFYEEQRQDYCLAIDTSVSMLSGVETPLIQHALDLSHSLLADFKKNKFKGSAFCDHDSKNLSKPQLLNNASFQALTKSLYAPKTITNSWALNEILSTLKNQAIKGTNVILISSGAWIDSAHSETIRQLKLAQHKNRLFLLGLFPLANIPTSGIYVFRDPITNEQCEIDFSYSPSIEFIKVRRKAWEKKLQVFCNTHGLHFLIPSN